MNSLMHFEKLGGISFRHLKLAIVTRSHLILGKY